MRLSFSERNWRHLSLNCLAQVVVIRILIFISSTSLAPTTIEAVKLAAELSQHECELDYFRLPQWLKPSHYELLIRPNLKQLSFTGKVAINLSVDKKHRKRTKVSLLIKNLFERKSAKKNQNSDPDDLHKIVLHLDKQLYIKSVSYVHANDSPPNTRGQKLPSRSVQVREICRDERHDLLVITLSETIKDTGGQLKLSFGGKIRTDLNGFYKSESGSFEEPEIIGVTQFESAHARKAFPCFDEPTFKATFALTLEHAAHLQALSNMQQISEPLPVFKDSQHLLRSRFATTPRMSTYLVAWAVGQFERVETEVEVSGGKSMRLAVWTAPGRAHEAQCALRQAVSSYGALRSFFNIEQPLEKIDILSVRELDAGAMENWGLIMFNEHHLLFDDTVDLMAGSTGTGSTRTPAELTYAVDVVTHELSHQWFGNLVTMSWWDDLWLNEGFATWITQQINQRLHPEFEYELTSLLDSLDGALRLDSKVATSHPIKNPALKTIKEIEDSFDEITYEKAASVIRMLNGHVGEKIFQRGIRRYFNQHLYGNTEARDLWESLEAEVAANGAGSGQISELMNSWLSQAGFPLITATLSGDGRLLKLEQERFLYSSDRMLNLEQQTWIIPVSLWVCCEQMESSQPAKLLHLTLNETSQYIRMPDWFDISTSGWVKLNARYSGFYRVAYDDGRLWKGLERSLKVIEPADRLNLVSDLGAIYQADRLQLQPLNKAISWFHEEQNDAVIVALARLIAGLELEGKYSDYDRTALLVRYYERTNKFKSETSDSLLRTRTRADVASLLVVIQNEQVTRDAIQVFDSSLSEVPYAFLQSIYTAVAAAGSGEQVARMLELIKSRSITSKNRLALEKYVQKFENSRQANQKRQQINESV